MRFKQAGILIGLIFFFLILVLPTFQTFQDFAHQYVAQQNSSMDSNQIATSIQTLLAVFVLMITWWLTEAVPLPATALLPAILFPILKIKGIEGANQYEFTFKNTLLNYSNPVIYLFLGGFLLAAAMQKWKIDKRFTIWLLTRGKLANDARYILLAMMMTTAFVSMWISNTATTAMMLPLSLGILSLIGTEPGDTRYGTALMLGIAWSASIGGVGTIIGSPPNGIALGILHTTFTNDSTYRQITFIDWMKFGVPYVLLFIPIAWFILLRMFAPKTKRFSSNRVQLLKEKEALGPISGGEIGTLIVVITAIILWITNPFWKDIFPQTLYQKLAWLDEYSIGLMCGVSLLCIPINIKQKVFLLDWKDTKFVDWGTLILFGGGIALSDAMFKTGLASWLAISFIDVFGTPSPFSMLVVIVLLIDFLTEITSNTAVTSMMVPIIISIAVNIGGDPVTLAVAVALASSMAFMLPVATPPNALVYGTGYVRLKDMIRVGFILDIIGWILTICILWFFAVNFLHILG